LFLAFQKKINNKEYREIAGFAKIRLHAPP
jgi:hypothetical protein